ncbi:hypothetical protein [Methylobacterium sp. Leaf117]|uniref:hypothetical protein n=1 Tax=Methylobacterium sp. Leaf117 TaxID=1736260 RepID=UPI0006FADEEE|nr:hypothetical protein [Methylobacterium sp. Leaf117]KQP79259.1 hypothetical protein ASF57_18840 [Methylobacterium sp. Leaf117]
MGKREFYWVRTGDEAKGEDGLRLAEVYVRDGHRDIYLTGRVECFDEHQVKLVRRIALPGEIDAEAERTVPLIVNGDRYQVPWRSADDVGAITARAVRMAMYRDGLPWEAKDRDGVVLAATDDPGRIWYIALRAGTAS